MMFMVSLPGVSGDSAKYQVSNGLCLAPTTVWIIA